MHDHATNTELPADPDGKNDSRATWAQQALVRFQEITGTDDGDAICDLLCNLMHLCDRSEEGVSFESQLERARKHYEAETSDEELEEVAPQFFYATLMIKQGGGYVRIQAGSEVEARNKMFASKYGKEWAFFYTSLEDMHETDAAKEVDYLP